MKTRRRHHIQSRRTRKRTTAKPSTALVTTAPVVAIKWMDRVLPQEKIDLIRRTIFKDASNDQLIRFLHICQHRELDPFANEVYGLLYHNDESRAGKGEKTMVIVVGIDGYRKMAARDHNDFAGTSAAEFTWFEPDKRTPRANARMPESATVWAFRKGGIKTSATAYWEEYAPADLTDRRADFWRRYPKVMLEKCAEAKALRKAFPNLGIFHIREELVQRDEEQTNGGREITDTKGFTMHGTPVTPQARFQLGRERAAQVKDEKMEQLQRYFCPKHRCDILKCPSDEHTQAELEAMDKLDAERKQAATTTDKSKGWDFFTPAKTEAEKPAIEVKPANKPAESNGQTVEVDSSNPQSPIIRGDITNLLPIMQKYLTMTWGQDSWWHCLPKDIPTLREMCGQLGFRLVEIGASKPFPATPASTGGKEPPPSKRAAGGTSAGTAGASAEPTLVKGILIRCDASTVRDGKVPTRQVKVDSVFYPCYRNTLFPFLDKHVGQKIEAFIDKRKQVVGLKSLGPLTFDTDGSTPCIDNATREAGTQTLFGQ